MTKMNNTPENMPSAFGESIATDNSLLKYVQAMSPETIAQLSHPVSQEVMQTMEHNIVSMLGGLPSQDFDVAITTSRESLGRLLASAMMSGYFLRGAEQRLSFENSVMEMGLDEEFVVSDRDE